MTDEKFDKALSRETTLNAIDDMEKAVKEFSDELDKETEGESNGPDSGSEKTVLLVIKTACLDSFRRGYRKGIKAQL